GRGARASARRLGGQLLARPEAQRHRLADRARPAQVLAVHGQQDPARVADLHAHIAVERPGHAAPADHIVLGQVRPGRRGEFDPAVLDGGQPDDNGVADTGGRGGRRGGGGGGGRRGVAGGGGRGGVAR